MNRNQQNSGEENILIEIMQFIRDLHSKGGISLIYTGGGVFILTMYSFFLCLQMKVPYQVPCIGIGFCLIGLCFHFLNQKQN